MALQVVGAGLPRTGTLSLKAALERLLAGPCYHMAELFEHPDHISTWRAAGTGDTVDWPAFFSGYAAAVDFPAAMYWRELMDVFPDAPVLLSVRDSAETWWRSMDKTILPNIRELREMKEIPPELAGFGEAMRGKMSNLMEVADDPAGGAAFYERHVTEVRATVPADRLVVWQPGDGWEPLANMLGVDVPAEPFPHENTVAGFQENFQDKSREFFREHS